MDVTGNGATPFLVFGLVQACGGLVGFVVYFMARRQERRQELYKQIWNHSKTLRRISTTCFSFKKKQSEQHHGKDILKKNFELWYNYNEAGSFEMEWITIQQQQHVI